MLGRMKVWVSRVAARVKAPFGMLRGIFPVGNVDPPVRGTREILESYEAMPWLRAVQDKVGVGVACLEWQLFGVRRGGAGKHVRQKALQRGSLREREKALSRLRRQGELTEVVDHPLFDALARPNPMMDQFTFMKVSMAHLDLVGDVFWLKERNGLGVLVGLWPVPPHWVIELPTAERLTYRIGYRSWQVTIPEAFIHRTHEPSPVHPYTRGSGVGWSIGDELEVDEYASKMAKQLFFNQARPDIVIYGMTDATEKRRVERDWINRLQGFWKQYKPIFMTGEPKFKEFVRPTMEQLVYPSLRKLHRDLVIQVYGFAPEMFGISEKGALSRTNYEGAEYITARWVILPRAERWRWSLQRLAEEEYDERLVVHFVSPVPADKRYLLDVRRAAPHAWRVDEWREQGGGEPLGSEEGSAFLVPLNSRVTDDLLDEIAARLAERPGASGGGEA